MAFKRVLEISFLALIFSLAFMQPSISAGGRLVTVTETVFSITGSIWFIGLLSGKTKFRLDPAFYLFGLYASALLLSTIFSENPRSSAFKFVGELYLIGLAVLTTNVVTSLGMLRKVVITWLAASAVTSMIGTLTVGSFYAGAANFITGFSMHHYGSLPPGNYPRIQSTFYYPSMLCNYLTISLMLLLAAFKMGWIKRGLLMTLLIIFAMTIAFTVTPGIGGVLLAVGLWYWFTESDDRPSISKAALAGGIVAAALFLLVSTFSLIHSPTSPYYFEFAGLQIEPTQRLLTWQGAADTFLNNPLFGKGLGLSVATVYFMPPSGQIQLLTDAHNAYLSVAGQAGIIALASIVLIAITLARRSFRSTSLHKESSLMLIALGIAFISAFIYQGLVGSFENARHLWVLMGLILAVSNLSESRSEPLS
jgi:O-antigen ligase